MECSYLSLLRACERLALRLGTGELTNLANASSPGVFGDGVHEAFSKMSDAGKNGNVELLDRPSALQVRPGVELFSSSSLNGTHGQKGP